MGLTLVGRTDAALAAFDYLVRTQRPDGSWPMVVRASGIEDAAADTNHCLYLATGIWHHYLATGRADVLARYWPTVERAVRFVLSALLPTGAPAWAVDEHGGVQDFALVTGSSSSAQSIECAVLMAERLGHDRPQWRWARDGIHRALRGYESSFADRGRYSMDWYYPVLCGVLRGADAHDRIEAGWDRFVWAGHGCRCVADEPWVTAAETAELVAALDAVGENDRAATLFAELQSLRDEESGGYWTGRNIPNDQVYPIERTGWTAAAVLLAADALTGTTAAAGLFRDAGSCLREVADGAAS